MPVAVIEDVHGNRLDFTYDSRQQLVEVRDPFRRCLELTYLYGLLSRVVLMSQDPDHAGTMLLTCAYDEDGRIVQTVDANGATCRFGYDGSKVVWYTSPLDGTYCANYDDRGRCVKYWHRDGTFSRELAYDSRGMTRVTNSLGYVWTHRFDERGLRTELTDPIGNVTRFAYDSSGGLLAVIGPTGTPTLAFGAEEGGKRLVEVTPLGATVVTEIGSRDDVVGIVDASGQKWRFEENAAGDVTRYTSPSGYTWVMQYDDRGSLSRMTDPGGDVTTCQVSADGRLERVSDSVGLLVKLETDPLGRVLRYEDGDAQLRIQYDRWTRTLTNNVGDTRLFEENAAGLPLRQQDELGAEWRYEWDLYGALTSIVDPLGHRIRFGYDAEGQPTSLVNELGERFENELDPVGRVVRQTEFNGQTATFEYDSAGDLLRATSAEGNSIEFEHDASGAIIASRSDGAVRAYRTDAAGRLVLAEEPESTLELEYDPEGRVVHENFNGAEVRYEYGWHSRPLNISYGTRNIRYCYDTRERLVSAEEAGGPTVTMAHLGDHGTVECRFGSGLVIKREADTLCRLVRQEVRSASGDELFTCHYQYDAASNLVERRRTGREPIVYRYTRRQELSAVQRDGQTIARYEFDPAGNRTRGPYGLSTYGAGGVLVRSPHGRYECDALGRPVGVQTERGLIEYAYDDLGRLEKVKRQDGSWTEFRYDALFRRRTRTAPAGVRRTTWATNSVLEEELPDRSSIKYLYDTTTEGPLAIELAGEWHYVVRDGHGDVTDLIRARDNAVVWSAEPLGFEVSVVVDNLSVPMPLRGPGQLIDDQTGLVYQRARYYLEEEGRFLTPDPLGPAGGPNPYAYCLNQPLLWIDPFGLNPCLSREDCERILNRVRASGAELAERWQEMRFPKAILPFTGLTRAAGRRAAMKAVAPGAQGAPNFGTKGTVESHVDKYEEVQQRHNESFKEYDQGQCQKHENKSDRKRVKELRQWRNKKPELHPDYGRKGATLPNVLSNRVTLV